MDRSELDKLATWLMHGARSASTPADFLKQMCERLVAAGIPLWRVGAFVQTLHPDVFGRSFVWRRGTEVVVTDAPFDIHDSPQFKNSPFPILYSSGHEVRYRLDDPESRRFPFFDDMRAEGVTDYIAVPLLFTDGRIHASSWATKVEGGFTDDHLAALRSVIHPLSRLAEIHAMRRTAAALLDTYVGNRAGERILAGQIRRGHTEAMQAAIWLSDLRGFTYLIAFRRKLSWTSSIGISIARSQPSASTAARY
jgi:adenylate cyclase